MSRYHRSARALHLLDIENLVCGLVTFDRVAAAWTGYAEAIPVHSIDHVIVGFCPETAAIGAFALPARIRKVVGRRGKDSADHALTESLDIPFLATRYTDVYIGSADHHFAALAADLATHGLTVTQVLAAGAGQSLSLARACRHHIQIRFPFDTAA